MTLNSDVKKESQEDIPDLLETTSSNYASYNDLKKAIEWVHVKILK